MAKRSNASNATKPTTRTTVTRSRKGRTTRTTTTRSTYNPGTRRATRARRAPAKTTITNTYVTKSGNNHTILAAIIVLLLLGVIAYLLMNPGIISSVFMSPSLTPTQESGQFASQLSAMQNDNQNLTAFYIANAASYHIPLNQSWSVQVTDQDAPYGAVAGQLTISWNGHIISIQQGIVNTGISPTYAVTLTHSEFMSFSQTVVTENTAAAAGYYSTYFLSGKVKYTRVS